MTLPIASKPNAGSEIAKQEGDRLNITEQYQTFLDDVEDELNDPSLPEFTVEDLTGAFASSDIREPASSRPNETVMVSNEVGGKVPAFSDGPPTDTTIFSITSVTDSGGVPKFNYSVGPTPVLVINQFVDISEFVTNLPYNGENKITAVDVAGPTITVSSVGGGGGNAIFNTSAAHGFIVDDEVTHDNFDVHSAEYDGVIVILSAPSTTTYTASKGGTPIIDVGTDDGTAIRNPSFTILALNFGSSETVGKFQLGANWRRFTDRAIIST